MSEEHELLLAIYPGIFFWSFLGLRMLSVVIWAAETRLDSPLNKGPTSNWAIFADPFFVTI